MQYKRNWNLRRRRKNGAGKIFEEIMGKTYPKITNRHKTYTKPTYLRTYKPMQNHIPKKLRVHQARKTNKQTNILYLDISYSNC